MKFDEYGVDFSHEIKLKISFFNTTDATLTPQRFEKVIF